MYPSTPTHTIQDESPEYRLRCEQLAFDLYRDIVENGVPNAPLALRGFTCRSAMEQYQQWHGKNRRCNPKTFDCLSRSFIDHFGDMPVAKLDAAAADRYMEALIAHQPAYAYDTIRLKIVTASGMVEYLRMKRIWSEPNPFQGIMKKYQGLIRPSRLGPTRIKDSEWMKIHTLIKQPKYKAARIFIQVSRMAGLRPSEVLRLDTSSLERKAMTWELLVTKRSGHPVSRTIAIPQALIDFIDHQGISGKLPLSHSTVRRQLAQISEQSQISSLTMKRFRKDFACHMEEIGAPPHIIDLHQGRAQSGVIYKHYLGGVSRAEKLSRPYIDKMFSHQEVHT